MRSKAEVGESKQGSASCSRLIFLVGPPGDDLERVIRQRPLQRPRLIPWRAHPDVALLVGRQDHRHGLGMDRLNDGVGRGRQETIDQMRARNGFRLSASVSLEFGPDASERKQRAILIQGEPHDVLLFGVGVRLGRVFREAVRRDQTAVLWLEPSPSVRRRRVPDVGDWVSDSTR